MYRNFILTDEERKEILEQHKSYGYKKPLYEQPTGETTTQIKDTSVGDVTKDLMGKTANFYLDQENKNFFATGIIKRITKGTMYTEVLLEFKDAGMVKFYYDCETKRYTNPKIKTETYFYSVYLSEELSKRFCDVSAGGADVPAADFKTP